MANDSEDVLPQVHANLPCANNVSIHLSQLCDNAAQKNGLLQSFKKRISGTHVWKKFKHSSKIHWGEKKYYALRDVERGQTLAAVAEERGHKWVLLRWAFVRF